MWDRDHLQDSNSIFNPQRNNADTRQHAHLNLNLWIHNHAKYTKQNMPAHALLLYDTDTEASSNNSCNINSFQRQTKPHPGRSHGQTDQACDKQTVAFGIKQKTPVAENEQRGSSNWIQSDYLSNI